MNREVEITIQSKRMEYMNGKETGRQIDEPIEVTNPATYFFKDGLHYVFYEEKQEGFTSITKNKIVIHNNKLELIQKGNTNSSMLFEQGQSYETIYTTPYLQMNMKIETLALSIETSEEEIKIQNKYCMELNGETYAICHMQIKIK